MSEFETIGLSISLFKPIVTIAVGAPTLPYTGTWAPEGAFIGSFASEVTAYQHSVLAMGGYGEASFSLVLNKTDTEWWLQEGLGLHVVVKNPAAITVWEGFVNELAISLGNLTMSLGPLMSIGNQVTAIYNLEDTSTTPPTTGVRMRTPAAEHLASEQRYGIFPKVITVGNTTVGLARDIRSLWTLERAWPETTKRVSMGGGGGDVILTFRCAGYYNLLNYPYNNTVPLPTGTVNVSTKIGSILTAAPNALFSTVTSLITTNTLQTTAFEGTDQLGWAIIKALVTHGDAAYTRYTAGVYAGRSLVYAPVSPTLAYFSRLSDTLQQVTDALGAPVQPWDVLPDRWLMFPDLLPGLDTGTSLLADPRAMFVEDVAYTAPYSLQLSGGKADKLAQRMAQLGLGGA